MARLKHKIRFQRVTASKRLQIMGLTIVILLAGIATYYTTYISNQQNYFVNRNFRELASFSDQISYRIENLSAVFKNAVIKSLKESSGDSRKIGKAFEDSLASSSETKFSDSKVRLLAEPRLVTTEEMEMDARDLKAAVNVIQEGGERWLELACGHSQFMFTTRVNFNGLINPLVGSRQPETLRR
jgi:hypothetical protein